MNGYVQIVRSPIRERGTTILCAYIVVSPLNSNHYPRYHSNLLYPIPIMKEKKKKNSMNLPLNLSLVINPPIKYAKIVQVFITRNAFSNMMLLCNPILIYANPVKSTKQSAQNKHVMKIEKIAICIHSQNWINSYHINLAFLDNPLVVCCFCLEQDASDTLPQPSYHHAYMLLALMTRIVELENQ